MVLIRYSSWYSSAHNLMVLMAELMVLIMCWCFSSVPAYFTIWHD
jgi:hypothetical protein